MHSVYMTLATADADGVPWASPVWYATEDGRDFYWVSDPGARHSRNIAQRPEIAIVIFDSTVTPVKPTPSISRPAPPRWAPTASRSSAAARRRRG